MREPVMDIKNEWRDWVILSVDTDQSTKQTRITVQHKHTKTELTTKSMSWENAYNQAWYLAEVLDDFLCYPCKPTFSFDADMGLHWLRGANGEGLRSAIWIAPTQTWVICHVCVISGSDAGDAGWRYQSAAYGSDGVHMIADQEMLAAYKKGIPDGTNSA